MFYHLNAYLSVGSIVCLAVNMNMSVHLHLCTYISLSHFDLSVSCHHSSLASTLSACLFSVFLSLYLIAFLCISAFLFISQPVLTCLSFVSWSAHQFLVRRICSCLFMCLTVPMSSCFILCPYCTSAYPVGVCSIFLCVDNL
jgi:multisubunit Na+/H+ antiporter MnhG subunit